MCGIQPGSFFKALTDGAATGNLYQDVAGTSGAMYQLTGWAGTEANLLVAKAEIGLEFLDGGGGMLGSSVVDLLPTLFVVKGEPFNYKKYTLSGVAPAGTVSARASMIGGMPNPAGGGQAYVVDDFSLVAIPEPSRFILGLLAVAGFAGSRRR